MLEVHFQSITIRFEELGLNWLQTPCWRLSQGSLLPTSCSLAMGAAFLCHQTQPALTLLPGLLSIPLADLWQPRWRGHKGNSLEL